MRRVVHLVGLRGTVTSLLSLARADLAPLPETMPEVVIVGSTDEPREPRAGSPGADERDEAVIVSCLEQTTRPGVGMVSICSGAASPF